MSKFQQFWWYMGVLMSSVGIVYAIFTKNVMLSIVCFAVALGLKKLQSKVAIPKVYADRGITPEMFGFNGRMKKDNEKDNQ